MAKLNPYSLSSQERKKLLNKFYSFINSLKTRKQTINFFQDLLTLSEKIMLARRIQIAKLLLKKESYEEIKKKLKVGTSTIISIQRWLKQGHKDYIKFLEKL